jgi:quercetin dioxygenase-like cupin family protein
MSRRLLFVAAGFVVVAGWAGAQEPARGYSQEIKVNQLMRTTTDAAGQPLVYPQTDQPQLTGVMVEIPPGAQTGWHKHPYPCVAYILSGSLTVEMEGGTVHQVTAGQALAESVNVMHNGKNTGTEPVKLVMFVMGEKEKPFTIKAAQ